MTVEPQEIHRLQEVSNTFDSIVAVMVELGMPTEIDDDDGEPYWPMFKWLRDLKSERDEYKRRADLCEREDGL